MKQNERKSMRGQYIMCGYLIEPEQRDWLRATGNASKWLRGMVMRAMKREELRARQKGAGE